MNFNAPPNSYAGKPIRPAVAGENPEIEGQIAEARRAVAEDRCLRLGRELSAVPGGFPFPGLTSAAYTKAKIESDADAGNPYAPTHIDELIKRLEAEGMKIALGVGNSFEVFVLPQGSDNMDDDGIFVKKLQPTDDMDPRLKQLILSTQA